MGREQTMEWRGEQTARKNENSNGVSRSPKKFKRSWTQKCNSRVLPQKHAHPTLERQSEESHPLTGYVAPQGIHSTCQPQLPFPPNGENNVYMEGYELHPGTAASPLEFSPAFNTLSPCQALQSDPWFRNSRPLIHDRCSDVFVSHLFLPSFPDQMRT